MIRLSKLMAHRGLCSRREADVYIEKGQVYVDGEVVQRARSLGLDPGEYLRRNDAYRFFQQTGGLIQTGPTHTNVCDVRVVTVDRG